MFPIKFNWGYEVWFLNDLMSLFEGSRTKIIQYIIYEMYNV